MQVKMIYQEYRRERHGIATDGSADRHYKVGSLRTTTVTIPGNYYSGKIFSEAAKQVAKRTLNQSLPTTHFAVVFEYHPLEKDNKSKEKT